MRAYAYFMSIFYSADFLLFLQMVWVRPNGERQRAQRIISEGIMFLV